MRPSRFKTVPIRYPFSTTDSKSLDHIELIEDDILIKQNRLASGSPSTSSKSKALSMMTTSNRSDRPAQRKISSGISNLKRTMKMSVTEKFPSRYTTKSVTFPKMKCVQVERNKGKESVHTEKLPSLDMDSALKERTRTYTVDSESEIGPKRTIVSRVLETKSKKCISFICPIILIGGLCTILILLFAGVFTPNDNEADKITNGTNFIIVNTTSEYVVTTAENLSNTTFENNSAVESASQ